MAKATATTRPAQLDTVTLTLSAKEAETLEALLGQFGEEAETLSIFCALANIFDSFNSPEDNIHKLNLKKKARHAIETRAAVKTFLPPR